MQEGCRPKIKARQNREFRHKQPSAYKHTLAFILCQNNKSNICLILGLIGHVNIIYKYIIKCVLIFDKNSRFHTFWQQRSTPQPSGVKEFRIVQAGRLMCTQMTAANAPQNHGSCRNTSSLCSSTRVNCSDI